ncbi:unnamed protein product [Closterium sp. Yama58-4]|nr:unnamed protein product [Closterium sp. Yama58-4]
MQQLPAAAVSISWHLIIFYLFLVHAGASLEGGQGLSFLEEVGMVARAQHKSVVRILGACHEGLERLVVYEHLPPRSSLFHRLHRCRDDVLSLEQRLRVAVEVAEGLCFLHSQRPPIVHRNLKPGNIMVSASGMQAKLADLCFAQLSSERRGSVVPRRAQEEGYVDPEVVLMPHQAPHTKSDVFSYGVVLLELLTGRLAIMPDQDDPHQRLNITDWAVHYIKEHEVHLITDPRIAIPAHLQAFQALGELAVDCVKMPSLRRPTMPTVLRRLLVIIKRRFSLRGTPPPDPTFSGFYADVAADATGAAGEGGGAAAAAAAAAAVAAAAAGGCFFSGEMLNSQDLNEAFFSGEMSGDLSGDYVSSQAHAFASAAGSGSFGAGSGSGAPIPGLSGELVSRSGLKRGSRGAEGSGAAVAGSAISEGDEGDGVGSRSRGSRGAGSVGGSSSKSGGGDGGGVGGGAAVLVSLPEDSGKADRSSGALYGLQVLSGEIAGPVEPTLSSASLARGVGYAGVVHSGELRSGELYSGVSSSGEIPFSFGLSGLDSGKGLKEGGKD